MISKLLNKLLSFYLLLKYPRVDPLLRYFYRDTIICQLVQTTYIIRDYFLKQKYKIVSFQGEFAPELQFALPFAYWHFKNGTLKKTRSSKYTRELYFFSADHEEIFDSRTNEGNYNFELPRILYSQNYDMSKWLSVPLKDHYKNDIYVFEKPSLVIANRYNEEWNGPPISFFDIPMLKFLIENLRENYTIIYNRPKVLNIVSDDSTIFDLNEYDWLRTEHPEVILLDDLYTENQANARSFNHLQLMVYANSDCFISTHGGTATLASYFGGINIILSKKGPEHHFNCYSKLYPQLSGAKIHHAKNEDELKKIVSLHYCRQLTEV